MLRFCFSFCVVVLVVFSSIFAGAQEKPLQKTPELFALIAETRQALESLPDAQKAPVLFQLLSLELRFTDKQPAQNTIQQVLKLIPSIEKESMQAQIIEAIAFAQADLGDYEQSVKTLDLIVKPLVRAEKQLDVAEKIIEDIEKIKKSNMDKNETVKQFDVTDLLRKSLAGAVETKDAALESLVTIILARELAKQGNIDESKILFEKARKKARELEEIEEQQVVALIVRSLILVDRQAEALAMIETVSDGEIKLQLLGVAALSFAQADKITDAINLVKVMKQGEIKNNTISIIVTKIAKTITIEQLLALAKLADSNEFREQLLLCTTDYWVGNNRDNDAEELAKQLENQQLLRQCHSKLLIDVGKFDDAVKIIETFDTAARSLMLQHLFTARAQQQNGITEELLNQISATYSEEEKKKIAILQQETENILKISNSEEQLARLFQMFPSQIQQDFFDPRGAKKTLELILKVTEKLDDPNKMIQSRLNVADIQTQMYDKSGVKENLNQLQKYLDEIKDVRVLKGLFPNESVQPEPAVSETSPPQQSQPIVKLNSSPSADEIAGNNNLFQVYVQITSLWHDIGENVEAKKSFQKAKDIADSESDTIRKVVKLLTLSRLLAQTQSE